MGRGEQYDKKHLHGGGGGGDGFPYKADGRARRLCVDVNRNLS